MSCRSGVICILEIYPREDMDNFGKSRLYHRERALSTREIIGNIIKCAIYRSLDRIDFWFDWTLGFRGISSVGLDNPVSFVGPYSCDF